MKTSEESRSQKSQGIRDTCADCRPRSGEDDAGNTRYLLSCYRHSWKGGVTVGDVALRKWR